MKSGVNLRAGTETIATTLFHVPTMFSGKPTHEASVPDQLTIFNHEDVLLVEDNTVNCLVAATLLRNWGLTVTTAVNGVIAVEQAMKKTFALILMDIQMPEMDGIMATKKIKEAGKSRNTPVVALTANVMPEQIEEYMEVGMVDVVSKPFLAAELNHAVAKYLVPVVPTEFRFFDPAKFQHQSMGDKQVEQELRTAFFDYTEPVLTSIEAALKSANPIDLAPLLHSLKGVIMMFSVESLSRDIALMEENVAVAHQPAYKKKMEHLIRDIRSMIAEFRSFTD